MQGPMALVPLVIPATASGIITTATGVVIDRSFNHHLFTATGTAMVGIITTTARFVRFGPLHFGSYAFRPMALRASTALLC